MPNVIKIDCPNNLEAQLNMSGHSSFEPDARLKIKNPNAKICQQIRQNQPTSKAQRLLRARPSFTNQIQRILGTYIIFLMLPLQAVASDMMPSEPVESIIAQLLNKGWMESYWIYAVLAFLLTLLGTLTYILRRAKTAPSQELKLIPNTPSEFADSPLKLSGLDEALGLQISKQVSEPYCDWWINANTRTGKIRFENQDAIGFIQLGERRYFGCVTDGAGGVPGGKLAAETVCNAVMNFVSDQYHAGVDCRELLSNAIKIARRTLLADEQKGITTAILFIVEKNHLYYATIGDGGLTIVYPDGMISNLLVPHHVLGQPKNILAGYLGEGPHNSVAPRVGTVELEPDSLLLVMSDGVSEIINENWLANNREQLLDELKSESSDPAKLILDDLESARNPKTDRLLHHDNMSLILCGWS